MNHLSTEPEFILEESAKTLPTGSGLEDSGYQQVVVDLELLLQALVVSTDMLGKIRIDMARLVHSVRGI